MTEDSIPYGYCQCGCGGLAPIAPDSDATRGYVKGAPRRFILGHSSKGRRRNPPVALGGNWIAEMRCYSSPCWTWQRPLTRKGYGSTWSYLRGCTIGAHRVSYEETYGLVPDGLQLDHLCRNRNCVNPDHLEAVTPLVHSRRRFDVKLDDDARRAIIALYESGAHTKRGLARQFGVDFNVIRNVLRAPPPPERV